MTTPKQLTRTGLIQVVIISFGYLHVQHPPKADITIDLREHLRNPDVHPELRELTGFDHAVWLKVMSTPGVIGLISGLAAVVNSLIPNAEQSTCRRMTL